MLVHNGFVLLCENHKYEERKRERKTPIRPNPVSFPSRSPRTQPFSFCPFSRTNRKKNRSIVHLHERSLMFYLFEVQNEDEKVKIITSAHAAIFLTKNEK